MAISIPTHLRLSLLKLLKPIIPNVCRTSSRGDRGTFGWGIQWAGPGIESGSNCRGKDGVEWDRMWSGRSVTPTWPWGMGRTGNKAHGGGASRWKGGDAARRGE